MTIQEMQKAVYQNKVDKGFNVTDVPQEFCLLYGEVAEAHEAWLKKHPDLGLELADIVIYTMGLAEILGFDLGKELEQKIKINKNRQYVIKNGVLVKVDA